MEFKHANILPSKAPSPNPDGTFTLSTTAPTDIWRIPPTRDDFNAPIIYLSIPVSSFKSARVTAQGAWKTQYDQGGLVVVLPPKKGSAQKRWVKTGIEFYNGKPRMSAVAATESADWSLLPLSAEDEAAGKMTVEIERDQEDGTWGNTLRILYAAAGGEKIAIRELPWAFYDLDESEEMWVGMFAAKPTVDENKELVVNFEGFAVEKRDG
ncbi:hypothetical protein G7Y89_g15537 [Cudoniella acicularis]|uniref:Uncharacterized protein n=1 Tax=Cudoniella acicularis TaxID=354080 RepID=A0A8H4QLF4_9HELO|nr:hypothetical protein G7Y89_g15537 [Cudoniella acicularis]